LIFRRELCKCYRRSLKQKAARKQTVTKAFSVKDFCIADKDLENVIFVGDECTGIWSGGDDFFFGCKTVLISSRLYSSPNS